MLGHFFGPRIEDFYHSLLKSHEALRPAIAQERHVCEGMA
jgi:hypothetical protein